MVVASLTKPALGVTTTLTVEAVTLLIEMALAREAMVTNAPVSTGTDDGTLTVGAATVTAAASYWDAGPVFPAASVTAFAAIDSTADPLAHPVRVTRSTVDPLEPVVTEHPVTPLTETSEEVNPVTASFMLIVYVNSFRFWVPLTPVTLDTAGAVLSMTALVDTVFESGMVTPPAVQLTELASNVTFRVPSPLPDWATFNV